MDNGWIIFPVVNNGQRIGRIPAGSVVRRNFRPVAGPANAIRSF
jgi:hypothetical protein